MQVKCEYCGAYIDEKAEYCEHCGAVNASFKRSVDDTPKTITELKIWYEKRNLPPMEVTRFFIGENYSGPRAFGIYEENGEYIVYKNKDDGSRAERYRGKDEAYAVNEIYLKLKSEILNQKAHNIKGGKSSKKGSLIQTVYGILSMVVVVVVMISAVFSMFSDMAKARKDKPYVGKYYYYDDNVYYCDSYVDDEWYWYDYDSQDYLPVSIPAEMHDDALNYTFDMDDSWDSGIERFEDTETGQYVESLRESSDSDSDYSWDSSDSWDSDSSDWDSDW